MYLMRHLKVLLILLAVLVLWGFSNNIVEGDEQITYGVAFTGIQTPEKPVRKVDIERIALIKKVDALVGNESVSTTIVDACKEQTEDYKLCIKQLIWVSNAESWIFKYWMSPSRNGFGLMEWSNYWYRKKRFKTIEESIYYWLNLYVKNGWHNRTTWQAWLNWHYCTEGCSHWIKNYEDWIRKLNID